MKSIQNKKIQAVAVVLSILLLCALFMLFTKDNPGRPLSKEAYISTVKSLVKEERNKQEQWNFLLGDMQTMALEDVCNQVYLEKVTILGQSFIDMEKKFLALDIEGNKETKIPDYQQYASYFEIFKCIGEQLQQLSKVLEVADYKGAVACLKTLQELNNKIPVIM